VSLDLVRAARGVHPGDRPRPGHCRSSRWRPGSWSRRPSTRSGSGRAGRPASISRRRSMSRGRKSTRSSGSSTPRDEPGVAYPRASRRPAVP
jgi:hypothetical protein